MGIVVAIALVVGGSIMSSVAGQQNNNYDPNGYPFETAQVVFGNGDGNGPVIEVTPAEPVAPAFVPAAFPRVDPLVATGSLSQARADHTATLLPDGRVVIAGGVSSSDSASASASIEIYDPRAMTFAPGGHLLTPRSHQTATLLKDGTVLFAGGSGSDGSALASTEIYDPKSGTSRAMSDMPVARTSASAVALDDGTILVVGGVDNGPVSSAEIYDPSSGTFKELTDAASGMLTAVKLADGGVLLAGGDKSTMQGNLIETLGTAGNIEMTTGLVSRDGPTSCLLADGHVLIVGGRGEGGEINTTAETFDPQLGPYESLVQLGSPRWHNTTTALPDGSALIVGGANDAGDPMATVELYTPGKDVTKPVGTMAKARAGHTATLLKDGSVLIVGGWSTSTTTVADAGLYFPKA